LGKEPDSFLAFFEISSSGNSNTFKHQDRFYRFENTDSFLKCHIWKRDKNDFIKNTFFDNTILIRNCLNFCTPDFKLAIVWTGSYAISGIMKKIEDNFHCCTVKVTMAYPESFTAMQSTLRLWPLHAFKFSILFVWRFHLWSIKTWYFVKEVNNKKRNNFVQESSNLIMWGRGKRTIFIINTYPRNCSNGTFMTLKCG